MILPMTEEAIYIAAKYSIEDLAIAYHASRFDIVWNETIANAVRIQCGMLCF